MKNKKALWKRILKILGILVGVFLAVVIVTVTILTITEYRPEDIEEVSVEEGAKTTLQKGDTLSILTWNIGYCGLGEDADFFMDGGSHVSSQTREQVLDNLAFVQEELQQVNPDIAFLQEVDIDSKRSYGTNQMEALEDSLADFDSTFALNYKAMYIPYPIPCIGRVEAGLGTFSQYEIEEATRISLPCPFSYPVRIAMLKRCIVENRIPIEGTNQELVVYNVHLEAYDDGEGRREQAQILYDVMKKEVDAGNYVIAGGDFNQTFSNIDVSMYPMISEDLWKPGLIEEEDFGDEFQLVMDNKTPSCRSLDSPLTDKDPKDAQYYVIDGFVVSNNITVEHYENLDLGFVHSDHNPLYMTFTLD